MKKYKKQMIADDANVIKKGKKTKLKSNINSNEASNPMIQGDQDHEKLKRNKKSSAVKGVEKEKKKRKLSAVDFEVDEIKAAKSPKKSKKSNETRQGSESTSGHFKVVSSSKHTNGDTRVKKRKKNKSDISTFEIRNAEDGTKKKKKRKKKTGSNDIPITSVALPLLLNSSSEIKSSTGNSFKKIKKIKSTVAAQINDIKFKSHTNKNRDTINNTSASVDSVTNITKKKKKKKKNKKTEEGTQHVVVADSDSDSDIPSEPIVLPALSMSTGFVWNATPNLLPGAAGPSCVEEESSDDEAIQKKKVKRSRQAIVSEKRLKAQVEEARLRSVEQRLMDPDQLPQTPDEFDRLVLSSPDNSMVWLQYMAYHIQATEIEKARSIAQRALKTISFREEQEKLNVWVAWLNLENLYGTHESMQNTLQEAIRLNDPYQVYTQTLQIYADCHKLQDGDELISVMTRKFKTIKDMWITVATFYMKSGQTVKARSLLQRALASLEKKEHVPVITQFALLENKLGSKERAQTLMEQILTSYPKRVDVWSVYVDMLVKCDLFDMARQVLERAVAQRLPSHKMKTLFKKFLAFEEAHGTEDGANKVRQLALEYVEAAAGTNME